MSTPATRSPFVKRAEALADWVLFRIVTRMALVAQVGWRVAEDLVGRGVHHRAGDGSPFWMQDELEDLIGMADLEARRDQRDLQAAYDEHRAERGGGTL
jgi:hypothetical protein